MNIFASDLYRLCKGATMRKTLIGLLIVIAFLAAIFFMLSSDGFAVFVDETAASQGASTGEIAQMRDELAEFEDYAPQNAAGFAREIIATDLLIFFFLPLIITIFCADFDNGTYRNTLSYESSRTKVYLSKLLLSICACLFLNLVMVVLSILIGGILFGFGGLTAAFFLQAIITILLLLPVQLGAIGFGHCLVAFCKKSSSVIAIYLVALMILTAVIQMVSMIPSFGWLSLLDWNAVGKRMIDYQAMPAGDMIIAVAAGFVIAAATTAVGLTHYRKTDMA